MNSIPELIFIVPFRNRKSQLNVFLNHMKWLLECKKYEIIISHQNDKRFFNRGAMKNLGFMYAKEKYPNDYKNITFVFHDVDCLVSEKTMTNFKTSVGRIKHIFGFRQTLGGIFSIKGQDYDAINGFPCIWNWGYEDNALRRRWVYFKSENNTYNPNCIDYSEFYGYQDKRIVQMWHGDKKIFNKTQAYKAYSDALISKDGLTTIRNIKKGEYKIDDSVTQVNYHTFTVFTPHPSSAEISALKTKEDLAWAPPKKPTGSSITRNAFKNIFGRRR